MYLSCIAANCHEHITDIYTWIYAFLRTAVNRPACSYDQDEVNREKRFFAECWHDMQKTLLHYAGNML